MEISARMGRLPGGGLRLVTSLAAAMAAALLVTAPASAAPNQQAPVEITVVESITVSDAPLVLPPVLLLVSESIGVGDAPGVFPPVSVSVSEAIAVADAPGVFPEPVPPPSVQQAKLTASDGLAGDQFGYSIAIGGDTAVVGASGNNNYQGSAYVFVRSGATWSQQAQLTALDGASGDRFGDSVAISGDTAVVGAPYDAVGPNSSQGSAYVFVRSGSTWSQQAKLTASDGLASDRFGFSVAISGDSAVIGALLDNVGLNSDQGSAYVFVRSGTTWSQQAQLTASDGAVDDRLGYSVAISGDTAVAGALLHDFSPNGDQGSAYVYVRSGTTWSQQAQLASDGGTDRFGNSVAIDGDTAVVGAYSDNGKGSAYVFVPVAPLPTSTPTPVPPTPTPTMTPTATPTPTPTPLPGVSGLGLGMMAGLLVAAFLWAYRRKRRQAGF